MCNKSKDSVMKEAIAAIPLLSTAFSKGVRAANPTKDLPYVRQDGTRYWVMDNETSIEHRAEADSWLIYSEDQVVAILSPLEFRSNYGDPLVIRRMEISIVPKMGLRTVAHLRASEVPQMSGQVNITNVFEYGETVIFTSTQAVTTEYFIKKVIEALPDIFNYQPVLDVVWDVIKHKMEYVHGYSSVTDTPGVPLGKPVEASEIEISYFEVR